MRNLIPPEQQPKVDLMLSGDMLSEAGEARIVPGFHVATTILAAAMIALTISFSINRSSLE